MNKSPRKLDNLDVMDKVLGRHNYQNRLEETDNLNRRIKSKVSRFH